MVTIGSNGDSDGTPPIGVSMQEAGSNHSFAVGNASKPEISISFRVPSYNSYGDDDSIIEMEAKNHIIEVKDVNDYSMTHLLADLAMKTKWGTCQEPSFWYWDTEKKGLACVVTDDDLKLVFQKYMTSKIVPLVVEFIIKPAYKSSMTLEYKVEKFPVRKIQLCHQNQILQP